MAAKKRQSTDSGTTSTRKRGRADVSESRFVVPTATDVCPLALNTHEIVLSGKIVPPPGPGKDRTQGDKDRFKDRMKGKLDKDKLKDILQNNPVFGDKGKVKVPVDGGKEPRWRPGRDGKGGGGKGRKGGKDPGDLVYIDMDMEEFTEWLFEELNLPFLLKKDQATTMIATYRMRGLTDTGPEPRINWEETEIRRIERGVGMLNSHPDTFPVLNDFVIESLTKAAHALKLRELTHPSAEMLDTAVAALSDFKTRGKEALPLKVEQTKSLIMLLASLMDFHREVNLEPDALLRLERFLRELKENPNELPLLVAGSDIPGKTDAPLQDDDFVYQRVEIKYEPDSKAVVFLLLDRSGSMGGDPLAIAKFYFLLNILFLRTKYKDVTVVMIAHDAAAYEIEEEQNFYKIEVAGGTMFVPAYELTIQIANERYPVSSYNRYMFHATDGYMFDGNDEITDWWVRLISKGGPECGAFNFAGYLEIDPWGGRFGGGGRVNWAPGGQALLNLPEDIKQHVGMARVSSMDEVVDAFKAILTGDKTEA